MGAGGTDPCARTLEEIQAEKEYIAALEWAQLNRLEVAGIRLQSSGNRKKPTKKPI